MADQLEEPVGADARSRGQATWSGVGHWTLSPIEQRVLAIHMIEQRLHLTAQFHIARTLSLEDTLPLGARTREQLIQHSLDAVPCDRRIHGAGTELMASTRRRC
jgi:ABC-type sugar transport system ATPase subunit